jgi:hypothetical protein
MINSQKILFFLIFVIVLVVQFPLMGCGQDDKKVWKAIPCKLRIIDCSADALPNTIDMRLLNDDGYVNDKFQFEQSIIEQNERKQKYKKDVF